MARRFVPNTDLLAPKSAVNAARVADQRLDPAVRSGMEADFGRDFADVRVHTGPRAAYAAAEVGADAFTVGSSIVFGHDRYSPRTPAGRQLLRHELTHVAQQPRGAVPDTVRVDADPGAERAAASPAGRPTTERSASVMTLQRQPSADVDLGVRFNNALASNDMNAAVRALAEMSPADREAAIDALDRNGRIRIRNAAMALDPSSSNVVAGSVEAVEHRAPSAAPRAPAPTPAAAPTLNVAAMSGAQKLQKAWEFADVSEEARRQLAGFFTLESLAIMAGMAALYIASQLTPAGWVADVLAVASLAIAAIFIGRALFDAVRDIVVFFGAVNATTEGELRRAGAAIAHALALIGITIVMEILMRGMRSGRAGGARPMTEPPPAGMADGITTSGTVARMPVQVAEEAGLMRGRTGSGEAPLSRAPAEPTVSRAPAEPLASRPRPVAPRGQEIWAELSGELNLEAAQPGRRAGGVEAAARDAQAGGLIGPRGSSGTVDVAVQSHSTSAATRRAYGVTGAEMESAHVGPTSALRNAEGYSRSRAQTVNLDRPVHRALDPYWEEWAMRQRRNGRTSCDVAELQQVMIEAIDQTPNLAQNVKNTMAWLLEQELTRLGLRRGMQIDLPYPNIRPGGP